MQRELDDAKCFWHGHERHVKLSCFWSMGKEQQVDFIWLDVYFWLPVKLNLITWNLSFLRYMNCNICLAGTLLTEPYAI